MDLIFCQPFPYKSLSFIHQYLHTFYTFSRPKKIKYFQLLFSLLSLKVIHYAAVGVLQPKTPLNKLLFVDVFVISNLPRLAANCMLISYLLLGGYFLLLNYFDPDSRFPVDIMRDFFVIGKTSLFTSGYFYKGNQTVFDHIKKYCYLVLNLLQVFIVAIDSFIILSQVIAFSMLISEVFSAEFGLFQKVAIFVLVQFNLITLYGALFTFSYSLMLQAALAFSLLEVVRLVLRELEQQVILLGGKVFKNSKIISNHKKASSPYQHARFRRHYTARVVTYCIGNAYVGKAFIPLLAVNCPANALLSIALLNLKLNTGVQLLLLAIFCMQFLCIFLVHSMIAYLNDKLNQIARQYVPLFYRQLGSSYLCFNQKQRLRGYLFLERFYTTKPYGFTYMRFGHISMFTFVKYLVLSSEMLMIVYKELQIHKAISWVEFVQFLYFKIKTKIIYQLKTKNCIF